MAQFAEQLLGNGKPKNADGYIEGRWEDFVHKGGKRAGLKHSLARTLGLDANTLKPQDCIDRIFGHAFEKFPKRADGKLHDAFRGVIGELFQEGRGLQPKNMANEDPSWLCWTDKPEKENTPAKSFYRKKRGIWGFMDELFDADADDLKMLSKCSVEESCLTSVESGDINNQSDGADDDSDACELESAEKSDQLDEKLFFVGTKAISQLESYLASARTALSDQAFLRDFRLLGGHDFDTDAELTRLTFKIAEAKSKVAQAPNSFFFQRWKRQGPKERDRLRVELFLLFHFDGGSRFTATLLRARLIRRKDSYIEHLHKTDKSRYVQFVERFGLCGQSFEGKEPVEKVNNAREAAQHQTAAASPAQVFTDHIKQLRTKLGYIFPSFTAMRGFLAQKADPAETNGACKLGYFGWTKFDNAAYEEAIKSPHQIRQKQKERDNEAKKLEELKKLYEGKGREKGKADDGEEEDFIPGGFREKGGDPRYTAMRRIHESLGVLDGADPKTIYRYGISQAALRGYEELREEWNKVVAPGEAYSPEKETKLKECIATYQRQHRDDMGDSRLFEELVKKDNWCVWQNPKEAEEKDRVEKFYSTNIVRDYLRYCDVLEDLDKKKRPVQYTSADARDSRRLFDFKGATQRGFGHTTNPDGLSFTTQIAVKCGDATGALYRPAEVRIHYTAPRLLRDEARLLSDNENLESANWAQPLMRALGIPGDDTHNFKKHAVVLMPDWKPGSNNDRPDRMLLNFVLTPKEDNFIAHVRKQMSREKWPWTMQFNWNGDGHNSTLRWPHEDWSKVKGKKEFPGQWFANPDLKSFRLLSVDLGQKQAGAYAILEVSCCLSDDEKKNARFIGSTEHDGERRDWYARVLTTGLLRLGEHLPEGARLRSLRLESEALGIVGVMDLVEGGADGAEIVDYKKGSARRNREGEREARETEMIQVGAYALLLQEQGVKVAGAKIYYAAEKRHVPVEINEALLDKVRQTIAEAKQLANSGKCPPPLKNDPRCLGCSAYPVCLPNESFWWARRRNTPVADGQLNFGFIAQSEDAVRDRILEALDFAAESGSARASRAGGRAPADDEFPDASDGASKATREGARAPLTLQPPRPEGDDGEILVVQTPGAMIGQRGDELIVSVKGEDMRKLPGQQVRAIYCYGAVQLTAQAVTTCLELGIDVSYFSPAGRFLGMLGGLPASGVDARRGQYRLFELPNVRLQLAREIIRAKIHNQRVMLMRNGDVPDRVTHLMAGFRDATESARDLTALLGIEGSAAALYFEQFESMLKQRDDWKFDWRGRNRRPPRDPVNALLSLGYSMLAKELTGVCYSVGLDPFLGFMHQPRYGRPALALDLMEEFRPLIADSVAISLINRGELGPEDFIKSANGTFLTDKGRRPFWEAWFRRLDTEVSHPEFSYKMAYRRMLEVQARQLWRFVRGEALTYHGFVTR